LPDVVDEQAPMKSISVAMAVRGARVEIMCNSLARESSDCVLLAVADGFSHHFYSPLSDAR
jgi:hypothetical protein